MATSIKSKTKYFCKDKEKLKDFMKSEGFIFKNSVEQLDEYYLDTEFNYDTNVSLRTINNKEIIVSFDGIPKNLSQIEIEDSTNLHIDISQKENVGRFIENLGYYKYVSINILKETYVKKDKEYYYRISIDSIENIGEFVDFDIYTENEDRNIVNDIFYDFENKLNSCVGDKVNFRYRDYACAYLYNTLLKGEALNRMLVEVDKVFPTMSSDNLEESIKNNITMLNLELIEKLEQKGISIEIVYSNSDEVMINALKKIVDRIGYSPLFTNIKDIKEIAVKETVIIEKQKKISLSEVALIILANRMNNI